MQNVYPEEATLPLLPWTLKQAAEIWGVAYTTVRRLVLQKRVKARRLGRAWMIWQVERPPPAPPGSLTFEQRAGWYRYGGAVKRERLERQLAALQAAGSIEPPTGGSTAPPRRRRGKRGA